MEDSDVVHYFIKKPMAKISSWNWFATCIIHDRAETSRSIPLTNIEAVTVKTSNMFLYIHRVIELQNFCDNVEYKNNHNNHHSNTFFLCYPHPSDFREMVELLSLPMV